MSELETPIMRRALVEMVQFGAMLWRNNVGTFIQGKARYIKRNIPEHRLQKGDIVVRYPRRIKCGLCVGSSDLIGFIPVTVTQEMVGQQLAVFVAAEAKNEDGRVTPEQHRYIEMVRQHGGIAFKFQSEQEAVAELQAQVNQKQRA